MALPVAIADATSGGCAGRRRPRVCGEGKERVARIIGVSDLGREGRVTSPLVAGPLLLLSPSLKQQKREGGEDKQKYYVNMGYAIRTLREEFPVIFYREPSFDIFREDVVFKDPLNTFVGLDNYKRIFWALRVCGRMFFKALWIDIVSVWQPADNIVMIRWIVHGIPRVPWESHSRFDGTSEYKLDSNGKIYEHRVDNVAINSPPKFRVLAVVELIQSLGCPSTPGPTYFETVLSHAKPWLPFMVRFTWVRYYLALRLILSWRCAPNG